MFEYFCILSVWWRARWALSIFLKVFSFWMSGGWVHWLVFPELFELFVDMNWLFCLSIWKL